MAGKQAFDNTNKGRFFLNERKRLKIPHYLDQVIIMGQTCE